MDVNLTFQGNFQVDKLELKEGEILVVRVDQQIDNRVYEAMHRGFKNFLKGAGYPQIPVLILEKGMDIEVADLSKIEIIKCDRCHQDGVPSQWAFVKGGNKQRICLFCESVMHDRADIIKDEEKRLFFLWEEHEN